MKFRRSIAIVQISSIKKSWYAETEKYVIIKSSDTSGFRRKRLSFSSTGVSSLLYDDVHIVDLGKRLQWSRCSDLLPAFVVATTES